MFRRLSCADAQTKLIIAPRCRRVYPGLLAISPHNAVFSRQGNLEFTMEFNEPFSLPACPAARSGFLSKTSDDRVTVYAFRSRPPIQSTRCPTRAISQRVATPGYQRSQPITSVWIGERLRLRVA